jgi:hypothetical protein
MAFVKYILPVLAAGHLALAASCNSTNPIKIASQGDADGYSSCTTIKGDIQIESAVAGDLTFNGVQQITGSLTCIGASNMSSLSAPSLNSIGNTFKLNGLTTLTTLGFGSLSSVGAIEWEALPNLQTLSFDHGVSTAGQVSITNTGLTTLNGISLETVGSFDITENTALQTVNVNQLKNSTGLINFAGNYDSLKIELPNLSTGTNMTFRNVSSVSIPSLRSLSGQLGFWGNTFTSLSAPNLTETGDLVFNDNTKISNVSMGQLQTVNGGFQIARNDKLADISFPKLQTITGALDFSGDFDQVDLPALKEIKGGFNMQSTGNFSCNTFNSDHGNIIKGTYSCKANNPDPTTKDGSSGTTTSSSSAHASSSTGAAVANLANVPAMGLAAIFGALLAL